MRRISFVWKITVLALIGFPLFFFHPTFRMVEAQPLTEQDFNNKASRRGMRLLANYVADNYADLRDSWGVMYDQSGKVTPRMFPGRERACNGLNEALGEMAEDQLSLARGRLMRYYNGYIKEVKSGGNENDLLPSNENDRILYGLYRYNRAVLLADLAERNSRGVRRQNGLLREALYDLRRTVASIERLGFLNDGGGTYWGAGIPAWEGGRLFPEHGNLPTYHIYTNLAVLYLRLGDKAGYPYVAPGYLQREQRKYALGDDDTLSPMVSSLIDTCLKRGDKLSISTFRLTMALHNMEAAARGMDGSNPDEDLFNYTIGILLAHLADDPHSGITPADAARFHHHARRLSNPNRAVYHLAGKELLLALLADKRLEEARTLLMEVDLGELDAAFKGPDQDRNRIFLDLAQFQHLLRGDTKKVATYLSRRDTELKDRALINQHELAVYALGRAYGRVMVSSLRQKGTTDTAGALHQMEGGADMTDLESLQNGIDDETRKLRLDPRVGINLWFRKHPAHHAKIRLAGYAAFVLFLIYLGWVYQSHRKVARQVLYSGYGEELG